MAAPPSPPYPKDCGSGWHSIGLATGELYGKGGFGKDYQKALPPLATEDDLKGIGSDRSAQEDLMTIIDAKIDELREEVADNSGAGGMRRFLTRKEQDSIVWLLDHAEAELDVANDIWKKWDDRVNGTYPLWMGDQVGDIPTLKPTFCTKPGQIIYGTEEFPGTIICPTTKELKQRGKDRTSIKKRFQWALTHVRCAEWGLNRILLYKQALADWKGIDYPEKIPVPPIPPPGPGAGGPGGFAPKLPDEDMCLKLGIGCPDLGPGLELPPQPPTPEGEVPVYPDDWNVDPDDLPDPDDVDVSEDVEKPKPKPKKKKKYSTATVVAGVAVGVIGGYGLYRLLLPR